MSTSERICYLKGGELFAVISGALRPISPEDMTSGKEKVSLLIDDSYFFYVGMDSISVTGKKLHSIAGNYLSLMFPGDMVKNFGVYQGSGFTIVFILSDELMKLIKEYPNIFSSAKKISTPFIELSAKYEDFVFKSSNRLYKKVGGTISSADSDDNVIRAEDLISEIETVKCSLSISGVNKASTLKSPYVLPAAALAICYIIFLIGRILSLNSISNVEEYYQNALNNVYASAGIKDSSDPYGLLLFKSKQSSKTFDGKKTLAIISELSDIVGKNAELNTISVRDKAVRVDGTAKDFAQVELLKKAAEEKLKTTVSMDDTKKTEKGVSFVMRYDQ